MLRRARSLAILVFVQACLGIGTVMMSVPLWLALIHQFGALAVLGHAVTNLRAMVPPRQPIAAGVPA